MRQLNTKMSKNEPVKEGTPEYIVIGKITKPHGVRGEVRVLPQTDVPERFTWLESVFVGDTEGEPIAVEHARIHKQMVLLKLVDVNHRDQADALRGKYLFVSEEDAIPLEEDEYFLFELEGLEVVTDDGRILGELAEIIETKANNVFVVRGDAGEVLLPDTEEVIQEIDFENGRMVVHLLPGLLKE